QDESAEGERAEIVGHLKRQAKWWPLTNLAKVTAFATALLFGNAAACLAAESSAIIVEIESPLSSPLPLQGYLRQTNSAGPSPAAVLLHGCDGNWEQLAKGWGKRRSA